MSEINVTPFVDVMLVLLIIFMVTAPLLTVGIPVDLPKLKANALTDQKDPLEVTVKLDGRVFLGESEVEVENIIPRLKAIIVGIFIGADLKKLGKPITNIKKIKCKQKEK